VDAYRTEEEQVEAIKRWWSENGKGVIAAVVIGVLGSVGWQSWQDRQVSQAEAASGVYQELLALSAQELSSDADKVRLDELTATLTEDYAGTGYARLGQLLQVSAWVSQGRAEDALAALQALESSVADDVAMYPIVKLRRARLQASLGDTEQALQALTSLETSAVAAAVWQAKADIYIVQEQYALAAEALSLALVADESGDLRSDLETKLAFVNARRDSNASPVASGE
jgi:predicted negative regulator of RcsB-dependent stress response